MANAAHGHSIMWIVGLSEEKRAVVPIDDTDPANWWPQMQKQFAYEVTPDLTVVNVSTDHGKVVCLHFETNRAPYFVKKAAAARQSERGPGRVDHRRSPMAYGHADADCDTRRVAVAVAAVRAHPET